MNGDDVHSCLVTNHDNGSVYICAESKPSEIIAKLQQVYEKMLESVDEDAEIDALKMKVSTLQSWVRDLTEQNTLLVETAEQLEKEAAERVSLLEERIRQTSQVALKYMTKLQDYDSQVQDLAGQKINLVSMTLSQEQLQTRVSNLQNDIKNLLELIQRGRNTGCWKFDDLTFKEVVWDDNFVGMLSTEQPQQHIFAEQKGGNNEPVPDTEDKNIAQKYQSQITMWQNKALEVEAKVKELEEDIIIKNNNLTDLQHQFAERQIHLESTLKENEKLCSQIKELMEQVSLKDKEIEKCKKTVLDMEKSSKDERAALTAEVAEKHDEIRSLTEKNKQLENRCRDANMQTQLKDDIIKQMRKDIKQLKTEVIDKNMQLNDTERHDIVSESIIQVPCIHQKTFCLTQHKPRRHAAAVIPTNDHIDYKNNIPKFCDTIPVKINSELSEVCSFCEKSNCRSFHNPEHLLHKNILHRKPHPRSPHHRSKFRTKATVAQENTTIKNTVVSLCLNLLQNFDLCDSCKGLIIEHMLN